MVVYAGAPEPPLVDGGELASRHQLLARLHWSLGEAFLMTWHVAYASEAKVRVKALARRWLALMETALPDGPSYHGERRRS